jgi:poly(3-hydroxybutyrate) depolymerase
MKIIFLISILFLSAFATEVGINSKKISVSGLSSGAFMAVQMHVAYSETIMGAAVFAGGPFYCAKGQMTTALTTCMAIGTGIDTTGIKSTIKSWESAGKIDNSAHLVDSRVYIFSGTSDSTVNPKVNKVNEDLYSELGATVQSEFTKAAGHTFPTMKYGNTCSMTQSPYIGKCDYDGAKVSLEHIYDTELAEPVAFDKSSIFTMSQSGSSMASQAYAYVPKACQSSEAECPLHVAFHGCQQSTKDIGMKYIEETGYNEVAEANGIVILYPQVVSQFLKNPNGCWDWWGYSGSDYATNSGSQMKGAKALIDKLVSGSVSLESAYPSNSVVSDALKEFTE